MSIGQRLKLFRKNNNITQSELGRLLNVTQAAVVAYEKGTRPITLDMAFKITERYKLSIDWLLTGSGEMFLGHSINVKPGVNQSKSRVAELEAEIESLKKSISELEEDNKELNYELLDRLKQLINLQGKLIPNGA